MEKLQKPQKLKSDALKKIKCKILSNMYLTLCYLIDILSSICRVGSSVSGVKKGFSFLKGYEESIT